MSQHPKPVTMALAAPLLLLAFATEQVSCFSLQHSTVQQVRYAPPLFATTSSSNGSLPADVQVVSCMPDPLPDNLKNHYYLLRHGQSTANVAGVISSSRSLAYSTRHGLTEVGVQQGEQAAEQVLQALEEDNVAQAGDTIVFVSSPFARAKQTAEACLGQLLSQPQLKDRIQRLGLKVGEEIVLNEKLMERYFGRLDDEAIYTYAYVWPVDRIDVTHTAFDVESVAAVCTRLRSLIVEDLESQFSHENGGKYHIVLTSHADVLQIAQLYAAGAENVGTFSSYRFGNGEVRAMKRSVNSLPEPAPLEAPKRGTQV